MLPNGELPCCIRGANGFAVRVVPAVEPNGEEALILPNAGNGEFGTAPLGDAKVVPAFTNIELEDVSVVPNALFVFATATPNPVPANGAELTLVESNCCELVVTNGLLIVDGAPNDIVSVFCALKTFGADTVVPKVLLLGC